MLMAIHLRMTSSSSVPRMGVPTRIEKAVSKIRLQQMIQDV